QPFCNGRLYGGRKQGNGLAHRSARRRIAARFRGIAAQAPRPAVSMRRPPTRGPQDPWTPRKIALRGHLCEPLPRRPTLDGPAHNAHLHSLYVCGTPHPAGDPAPRPVAGAAKIGLTGLPAALTLRVTPRPPAPPALHFLFIGPSG